eukprot:359014-Chlamydomonas_euryale.AAC.6
MGAHPKDDTHVPDGIQPRLHAERFGGWWRARNGGWAAWTDGDPHTAKSKSRTWPSGAALILCHAATPHTRRSGSLAPPDMLFGFTSAQRCTVAHNRSS